MSRLEFSYYFDVDHSFEDVFGAPGPLIVGRGEDLSDM